MDKGHNIKRGYRTDINEQIDEIIKTIEKVEKKFNVKIMFDNTRANKYTLTINDNNYSFSLYRDVLNALNMLLQI